MFYKNGAGGPRKFRAITTEMVTQIPQRRGLENSIDNGVDDDISVTVPRESFFPRPHQSREIQGAFVIESVHIHCEPHQRGVTVVKKARSALQILRVGDFEPCSFALHRIHSVSG